MRKLAEAQAAEPFAGWAAPATHPALAPGDVHVWCASASEHAPREREFFATLAPDERNRARRFHAPIHRLRYVVSHGLLRALLARYTGVEADRLAFASGPFGKPSLALDELAPHFNLSHSGDLTLIAVSGARTVGVDIERWTEFDYDALAEFSFSDLERRQLRSLPAAQFAQGFFGAWTRKEAYIKATGLGVSEGLDYFDVTLLPGLPAALLADRRAPSAAERWTLLDLAAARGYSAALAVERGPGDVLRLRLAPSGTGDAAC